MDKEKKFRKILIAIGAVISYNVGAGFASGNEILQFYASWDVAGMIEALGCGCLVTVLFCTVIFWLGQLSKQQEEVKAYQWVVGEKTGRVFQLFTDIMVLGCFMLMFSRASNVLYQQFHVPYFLGALVLGIVSLVVVIGGLKKVETVLGYVGIIILVYVGVFAFYSLFGGHSSPDNMAFIPEAVEQGKVLRANLLALFPFSLVPKLASFNTPALEGILYSTECIVTGFPFFFTLGKSFRNEKQAIWAGILSGLAFYSCISFVVIILTFNFDTLINPETGAMFIFPALAVINKLWKNGSWTYSLVIFAGIFSSAVGYLWVMNERIFPKKEEKEENVHSRVFVVAITLAGILVGNKIPFSELINILFPICGFVGIWLLILCIMKLLKIKKENKN